MSLYDFELVFRSLCVLLILYELNLVQLQNFMGVYVNIFLCMCGDVGDDWGGLSFYMMLEPITHVAHILWRQVPEF